MGVQMCVRFHTTKHKVEISVIWLIEPKKIQTKIKHFKAWLRQLAWGLSSLEVCISVWCVCVFVWVGDHIAYFCFSSCCSSLCFHAPDSAFLLTCAIFKNGDMLFPNITTDYNNSSQQLLWSHNTRTQDIHSKPPYPTLSSHSISGL